MRNTRPYRHSLLLFFLHWPMYLLLIACVGCSSLIEEPYADPKEEVRNTLAPESKWAQPQSGEFVIQRGWWKAFGDPRLDSLIQAATSNNIDLKLLVKRVNKAEIELKGAKRDQWPTLRAGAEYSATRQMTHSSPASGSQSSYSGSAGIQWQADLWGELKQKKEAQWNRFQATEADWRAGYLTLIAKVTDAYFTACQLDEQTALHMVSLASARKTLEIYRRRVEGGVENRERLNNQKAEVLRLERELLEIKRQRQIRVNEIAYLLGKAAGSFSLPAASLREQVRFIVIPNELTASLLERRPDLVAAELRVKRAYNLREANRAARMPSVSLGLSADISGAALNVLTQNWAAAILPRIDFPSLDPETKTRLNLSEVDMEAARENYKKSVLQAIREVEDALTNLQSHQQQLAVENRRVKELLAAQEKAKIRLQGGIISQLEVFETERRLLESKQKSLQVYRLILQDIVKLHNALGGGWTQ